MKSYPILVVALKEWREIVRDRLFFALAFVVPSALMLLIGFGLSLDVKDIALAIVDYDQTMLSRDYVHRFTDSRYFAFHGYAQSEKELEKLILNNTLRAVIVIPPQFERRLRSGHPAEVQTWIDGTFPLRAVSTRAYIAAINAAMSLESVSTYVSNALGISSDQARSMLQPIRLETRYLYNQEAKSIWSVAPKLIMVILMLAPPFLTAMGVVREKESGAIYNLYSSTLSRSEYLIGKLLPYVGISFLNALLLSALAILLFNTPFKGDPLFFLISTALYVVCTCGIGLLVSVLVNTQIAAIITTAVVTVVPALLYSGMMIPIPSLSAVATVIAHLLPGMYYGEIVIGCFLKGIGFAALWSNLLILGLYASALFCTGLLAFSKRPAS